MNSANSNKLMTIEELADKLSMKKSTLYQWTHEGFIPHIKMGKLLRFRWSDVERWLDERTRNGRKRRVPDILM
jgi:nitrogen PTS system EIIA component